MDPLTKDNRNPKDNMFKFKHTFPTWYRPEILMLINMNSAYTDSEREKSGY